MAKAPTPGTTRPNPDANKAVIVTVNGESFSFSAQEISANDAAALRKSTGMSLRTILDAATRDPDIDVVAALLWLSRRQNGEPRVAFETVAAEIHYDSKFSLSVGEPDTEDDSPEA